MSGAIKLFLNRGCRFQLILIRPLLKKKDKNDNTDENTFDVIKYLESFEDSDVYGSSGLIND